MNSRREFLVAAGILASSAFVESMVSRAVAFKNNGGLANASHIRDTWFANNEQSPNAYLRAQGEQLVSAEDLTHIVRRDFQNENVISHDGFVFSMTEFAVLTTVAISNG